MQQAHTRHTTSQAALTLPVTQACKASCPPYPPPPRQPPQLDQLARQACQLQPATRSLPLRRLRRRVLLPPLLEMLLRVKARPQQLLLLPPPPSRPRVSPVSGPLASHTRP